MMKIYDEDYKRIRVLWVYYHSVLAKMTKNSHRVFFSECSEYVKMENK